ncbi:MAG: transposase [Candidatus Methanomethylophilaceae archaeon]|nr:transposase [Candidatus Methanomethylophilaceae archaeon]
MPRFRNVRYRLYPNRTQAKQMDNFLELCMLAYNKEAEMCRRAFEADGRILDSDSIHEYCEYVLKLEIPQLDLVFPDCLGDVALRVHRAFSRFQSLRSSGDHSAALPADKDLDRYCSFTYPRYKGDVRLIPGGRLWLHGIGNVKCVAHRPMEGAPFSCTVTKSLTGKWYATIFLIQNDEGCQSERTRDAKPVGIDLGLNNLAAFSDGTFYDNKKQYDRMSSKMIKIQRKMASYEIGSEEHTRYKRRLDHLFEHYNNQMKDDMHKRSTAIVGSYSMIALEDIDVKKMIGHYRTHAGRRSQSTAAWRTFVGMIEYKAEKAGVEVVFVNPRNTSQICSGCGFYVKKDLGVRVHECPMCGLVIDRDVNAAKNILRIGLGMQASVTGNRNGRARV